MKEQQKYLAGEAARLIRECRTDGVDGTPIYAPVARGAYYGTGVYLRDFEYMVEGCPAAFGTEEIRKVYLCFVSRQRSDGVIPCVVRKDGTPKYLCHGAAPCTDNEQFLVKLAYEYYELTKDISLFMDTSSALIRGLHSLPRHPTSGLIWIDPAKPHSAYGFTDTIAKTGEVLFSSMLYWEALRNLSDLFRIGGDMKQAEEWHEQAEKIKRSLQAFWVPEESLFRAATIDGNLPDVWGSAYAVYIGLAVREQAKMISEFFLSNYAKVVKRGQVRHIIKGASWDRLLTKNVEACGPERFQNGAYWGTPVGWVSYTLRQTDPGLANRIYEEMIADYQTNGIYECVNDGYQRCKDYVVSAALPLKDFPGQEDKEA